METLPERKAILEKYASTTGKDLFYHPE